MKNKGIIAAAVGLAIAGTTLGALKKEPKLTKLTKQEHASVVTQKINYLDNDAKAKKDKDTETALGMVLALYARREAGDEPTEEEWQAVENTIVEMRQKKDSPELYHADRLIDLQDADQEWVDKEIATW
jgi:hypothetical protein